MRRAFTIIELLVVVSIISVLAALLIPAVNMVRESANGANCQNNQRQLVVAMLAYAKDNELRWPAAALSGANTWVDLANQAATGDNGWSAVASLELLVVETGEEIPNKVFFCPAVPIRGPATIPIGSDTDFEWTYAGGAATDVPAYAYDWSVPANGNSSRVVLADRGTQNHHEMAMAAFFDGHTEQIKATEGVPSTVANAVSNWDGTSTLPCYNELLGSQDDIFDRDTAEEDATLMARPGQGSLTRTWVR